MTTTTIEKELVELETQFWQAMKDQDVETATQLTDSTCIVAGADLSHVGAYFQDDTPLTGAVDGTVLLHRALAVG